MKTSTATLSQLDTLLAYHEQAAANIRGTLTILRNGHASPPAPEADAVAVEPIVQTAHTRTRRRMSRAARKAVSARMTKYWAARRKEKGRSARA